MLQIKCTGNIFKDKGMALINNINTTIVNKHYKYIFLLKKMYLHMTLLKPRDDKELLNRIAPPPPPNYLLK